MKNLAKLILRLANLGILAFVLTYWLVLIGYSVVKLITGGPSATLAWYEHISYNPTAPFQHWSLKTFLFKQIAVLLSTISLVLMARRWEPIRQSNRHHLH